MNKFLPAIARKRAGGAGTWTANNATLSAKDAMRKAYWKLEDLSDSIGSHTLTNVNGTTFIASKHNNGANCDDGSAQYLTALDSEDWHLNQDHLIAGWVRFEPAGAVNASYVIAQIKTLSNFGFAWQVDTTASPDKLTLYVSASGTAWDLVNGLDFGTLPSSTWQHFAAGCVGTNWRTYVGGSPGNNTTVGGTAHNSNSLLYLGRNDITPRAYNGGLDEFGVWKGASMWASTAEMDAFVSALYNSGTGAFLI